MFWDQGCYYYQFRETAVRLVTVQGPGSFNAFVCKRAETLYGIKQWAHPLADLNSIMGCCTHLFERLCKDYVCVCFFHLLLLHAISERCFLWLFLFCLTGYSTNEGNNLVSLLPGSSVYYFICTDSTHLNINNVG